MPFPGWLTEGAKWGGGTICGVLVTLLLTSYVERPRPSVEIAQISITEYGGDLKKDGPERLVSVPLMDSLFSELAQSAWTESFRDPSDDLAKVTAKLNRNKEYVESYLNHAGSYLQLKKEMTLLLNGEKSAKAAENFFDDWQQVDGFIYGSVRSQMRYGSSALQQIKCEQEAPDSHLRKLTYHKDPDARYFARAISEIYAAILKSPRKLSGEPGDYEVAPSGSVDEHIYSVTKVGGRYKSRFDLRSNLDENEIVTPSEERCAENVMAALADFDKERLNAILDLTDQEAKNVELHKKIQSELEQHIKGYSFWDASMLVSNKGKNPISFSPNATLYIDMSGTTINSGRNVIISLKAKKGKGDDDTITVPGGESRSINFVSSDLVKDYGDWKNVIAAFEQSSRNCIVVLYPQTGDWQQDKLIYSPIKNFGPPTKAGLTEAQNINARFTAQHDPGIFEAFRRLF